MSLLRSPGPLRVALLAASLAVASSARAQGTTSAGDGAPAVRAGAPIEDAALGFRTMRAGRAAGAIRLDGVLDEPSWEHVPAASDFRQSWPNDRAPATERTEVRVLYDDDALYVGVRLYDTHPDSIASQLARRDASGIYSDWVHVVIDSYHDRRTAFRFSVNPKGVQKDVRHFDDNNEDLNWDAVWQVATTVDARGWAAEYRIPFSQLRFNRCRARPATEGMIARQSVGGHVERAGDGAAVDASYESDPPAAGSACVWGINVQRDLARRGERSGWSYVPQNVNAYVSRMGDLTGIDGIPQPGRLEVLPYLSSTLTRDTVQTGNPFYQRNASAVSAGADFKYGLTPGLTINGTINPDFGQVELDPAVVNLTQFENFFPERRPFFVEGADLFRFGDTRSYNNFGFGQFFYSRRIGRSPQRGVSADDVRGDPPAGSAIVARNVLFADPPQTSTILGAAKLSGKTAGGWTVAVLDAVTARETAAFEQELVTVDGGLDTSRVTARHRAPVEPLTNYLVARTRRDLNGGRSVIGALVTGVNRRLDDVFESQLRSSAYSGGVDFDHTWADRTWSLSGFLAASRINGDSLAIVRAQRSFVRYYQRPDADYLSVDSSRRSLSGYQSSLALTKTGGRHWIGSLTFQTASPGFEVNDVGFQQSTDRRAASTYLEYRENVAGSRFRNYGIFAYSNHSYNFGGDNVFQAATLGAYGQLLNFWNVNLQGRYDPAYYRDRVTRGGVLMSNPTGWSASAGISSDSRKPVIVGLNLFDREDATTAFDRQIGVSLDVRPTSFIRVVFEPGFVRSVSSSQWLDAHDVPAMTATGGRREVFSDVTTNELSFPLRVNWTFTPRVSLEVVAQPLVSANHFYGYKQLRAARTHEFDVYGKDVGTITGSDQDGYTVSVDGDTFDVGPLDFTQRSLRGSAVMRWEYRPGSALFFVWQQTRDGTSSVGEFDPGHDVGAVFRERERNVFVVKGTWWIAR